MSELEQYLRDSVAKAEATAATASARLSTHEQICAERYTRLQVLQETMKAQIKRVELILYAMIGLLMIGDGTIVSVLARLAGVKP